MRPPIAPMGNIGRLPPDTKLIRPKWMSDYDWRMYTRQMEPGIPEETEVEQPTAPTMDAVAPRQLFQSVPISGNPTALPYTAAANAAVPSNMIDWLESALKQKQKSEIPTFEEKTAEATMRRPFDGITKEAMEKEAFLPAIIPFLPMLARAGLSAYFGYQGLKGIKNDVPALWDSIKQGDWRGIAGNAGRTALDVAGIAIPGGSLLRTGLGAKAILKSRNLANTFKGIGANPALESAAVVPGANVSGGIKGALFNPSGMASDTIAGSRNIHANWQAWRQLPQAKEMASDYDRMRGFLQQVNPGKVPTATDVEKALGAMKDYRNLRPEFSRAHRITNKFMGMGTLGLYPATERVSNWGARQLGKMGVPQGVGGMAANTALWMGGYNLADKIAPMPEGEVHPSRIDQALEAPVVPDMVRKPIWRFINENAPEVEEAAPGGYSRYQMQRRPFSGVA